MSKEVRVTFYEFDGALFAAYFEYPEPAYIWTAMFVSQTTRHRNLSSIRLQESQVGGLGRAAYGHHFRTIFEDDYKAHV